MKEFKIRCSQIGKIMGEPKLKADKEAGKLSQTAKTYCEDWLKEQLYGRKKEFSNKYTEKGEIVEQDSIDFIAEQLNFNMLIKNETFFADDFMEGTPDVYIPELIDVKNSWDCFTFPLFETEIPNKDYYWQLQGYMNLTQKKTSKLIYVLSDTPHHLIQKEAYWYAKNNGYDEPDEDMLNEFKAKMTYKDIPDNLKIKIFDVDRNDDDINKIKEQVIKCRNYIKTLTK
jgi:hypothetical protein